MDAKLKSLKQAIAGALELNNTIASGKIRDEVAIDGMKNGLAQKFEYSVELCWKALKAFLLDNDAIDARSPKKVVKEFYLIGYVDDEIYRELIKALDYRNKLSHIYDEETFETVINEIPALLQALETAVKVLENERQ